MSAKSGCGTPSIIIAPQQQQPQQTSIIMEKSPTIIVAAAGQTTINNVNCTPGNIVVADLINSSTGTGSSKADSINAHHHYLQQQTLDLAHGVPVVQQHHVVRTTPGGPGSVLQLHPIGTFRTTTTAKGTALNSSSTVLTSTNTNSTNNLTSGSITNAHPPMAIIMDKSPTIIVAASTQATANHLNCNPGNIVVGDLINSKTESISINAHHHYLQQQVINLAHGAPQRQHQVVSGLRTTPGGHSSVLQLQPIGTFRTTSKGTALNSSTTVITSTNANTTNNITSSFIQGTTTSTHPATSIIMNRTGSNLTILPARVPFNTTGNNGSTALQFARGAIRPTATLNTSGGQPGSITLTPISGPTGIRIGSATVNNGSWNHPHGATLTPIRPISVATRGLRPEAKVIHIPQLGTVQHLTQLQVLDGKGAAVLKPQTPIRTILTSNPSVSGTPITVPITPSFTIRSAIPNTQRPNSSHATMQKVITQPAHGPPIQLVSGSKLSQHVIQTIPRLTLSNPVCLTISTNASLNTNNGTPLVTATSKVGASLIMNPSLSTGNNTIPLGKMYDVNPLLSMLAKNQAMGGHIIATPTTSNISSHTTSLVIPSHIISQSTNPVTTSITTAVSIPSTTSVIVTPASIENSMNSNVQSSLLQTSSVNSTISGTSSAVPTTSSIIVSNPNSNSNSTMQSPSQNQTTAQTKTTLSPRPSILRKRDAPISDNVQLRAQRNLALNFGLSNANVGSGSNVGTAGSFNSVSATISATAVAAAANKENNNTNTITNSACLPGNNIISCNSSSGLGSLKKEFQPPNEESCSSNSSSGSTTLSTTSETAEIQLQQQSLGVTTANLTTNVSSNSIYNLSNGISSNRGSNNSNPTSITIHPIYTSTNAQNGSFRATNTPSGRSRQSSTSKAFNKDLDRVKCIKGKDDNVSPRKKPRKQQLTTSDLLESSSSEISFYQGKRLKRSELLDPSLFQGFPDKFSPETHKEEPPSPRVSFVIKKPHLSLLECDKLVGKMRLNHFQKYTDVKPKEEKRPTIIELANQKDIFQKANGWKLQHLSNHLRDVIQTETSVVSDFNSLLEKIETKTGPSSNIRDLNRIQELLKGNIQRCKVITDQMSEANSQISRILEHKSSIGELLSKYVNKRPSKKRERL